MKAEEIHMFIGMHGDGARTHIRPMVILFICMSFVATCILSACSGPINTTTALSGHITVSGSTALQPLAITAARLFEKQQPQAKIDVQGGGSVKGLTDVTGQKVNIGDADIYADPALYPDPNLTDHIVCIVPFTMIVNPDVPLNSLTSQNIIDIFSTGKISNWAMLGGPNVPIVPVVRPSTSGTRATFRKYILSGRDEIGTLLPTDSSTAVLSKVAKTPGAIGYLALSVLNQSVHAISIDGQNPTSANIEAGRYTFWSYEHMYTLGDDNPIVSAFLEFMLTPTMQQQAQAQHYIPISSIQLSSRGKPALAMEPFADSSKSEEYAS